MLKVSNRKYIWQLSWKTLEASKIRNVIAILAIALTTILFTSLFTIAISINDGIEQNTFRQVGGYSHGGFKYLTEEQFQELREDSLIKEWGVRRYIGMPIDVPFNKSHVEISFADANTARWMYCDPVEGRLPKEGTNEAATDLKVLGLLGVEPIIGNEFSITFHVDGHETTQTFTLCGWWEYDEAIVANHVLIPESRVNSILEETGINPSDALDGMTGRWNLDVMLDSTLHIESDLKQILENHGYQTDELVQAEYIDIGVNWAYTGAQMSNLGWDSMTILSIGAILLLIIFTGYLIIYNVFQISVTNDIRFYGLLKTIGTTPKQLKRIIRQQAVMLCIIGIPLGMVPGWLIGSRLTPVVVERLNGVYLMVSVDPVIFIVASLFALFTVMISCAKPGRIAARVSPIEAVRYTGVSGSRRKEKKTGRITMIGLAGSNIGRNKGKTTITILSLSLSVVLLTVTVTFTNGFDMDKYLSNFVSTDFIVANAAYFQSGRGFTSENAVGQECIDSLNAQSGITESGRVYGKVSSVQEFISEEWYRSSYGRWLTSEQLDENLVMKERNKEGLIAKEAQIYGMEKLVLDQLRVFEGELSGLYEPGSHKIAAVYSEDDYGNINADSHWAKVGDIITLQYVETYEYYNPLTGEVYENLEMIREDQPCFTRAVKYQNVEYEVVALVSVPHALSYRYYGLDEFVLNDQTFVQDTGTDSVMLYAFNTTEEENASMEAFLQNYTQKADVSYNYESKATYVSRFDNFRSMFLLLGGMLSVIVGLVGVLNFFNAVLTSILSRKREFAVMQSIGMTGKQLKRMLVYEGLFYAIGSLIFSLGLVVVFSPILAPVMESMFWFCSYKFTVVPILVVAPIFVLLGWIVPLGVYRTIERMTVVERLREAEN